MTRASDKLLQLLYKIAYRIYVVFCYIFRPATHGVIIAVWQADKLLIIKNSYHRQYTLPGGHVRRNEAEESAAVRELREEVNLQVHPDQLRRVATFQGTIQYRRETLSLFETRVEPTDAIQADNREVISAEFLTVSQALRLNLASDVKAYLHRLKATEA